MKTYTICPFYNENIIHLFKTINFLLINFLLILYKNIINTLILKYYDKYLRNSQIGTFSTFQF